MRFQEVVLAGLPLASKAANIVLSNDDGWAEKNIRTFYDALTATCENVLISAPADNKSGTGSSDAIPLPRTQPCEFDSCPANSPATGADPKNRRFNYVNSFPATSMRYGIKTLAPEIFGQAPNFTVAGPNVGSNLGPVVFVSGTVGAAVESVKNGIPSIAFSGTSGDQISYTEETPLYSQVYADLSAKVTKTILESGAPYLPNDTWLNVNYPAVNATNCSSAKDFKFVLSRIFEVTARSPYDVETCGTNRLPVETRVVSTNGCYVPISLGTSAKESGGAAAQSVVLKKLAPILSCLPAQ